MNADQVVVFLSAVAGVGFWAACKLHDVLSQRRGPQGVGTTQPDTCGRAVPPERRPSALFDWAEANIR